MKEEGQWSSGDRPTVTLFSCFFCWRLLGLIPGGAPFSQLSSGAKDAMVVFTRLVKGHFMTKACKRPYKQHTEQKG